MRVLIIRMGAFGDIIHTLPLAADLAAAGHQVDWLCDDRWAVILTGNGVVGTIHEIPRRQVRDRRRPLADRYLVLRRIVRALRACAYDAVIDAQGLAKSALMAYAAGARRRIGHPYPLAREGSWMVGRQRPPGGAEHVIDQQRRLGLPLVGRDHRMGPWRFPLPAWSSERGWAATWLMRQGLAVSGALRPWMLNVGAGWPTKVWPRRRQTELIALLARRRFPVLLVWGSRTEHDLAEEIIAEAGYGLLAPATTIPQLAGLLSHARVLVSGDTGPLHLAFALGTPSVGLFGPVPAVRNGPRGRGYRNLQAPAAPWERHDLSRSDMAAISAEAVLARGLDAIADLPS